MTTHEQKAQELAERCASQFIDRGIMLAPLPGNKPTVPMEIILSELNLAKLLEDAAMLDWLEHGANLHKMDETAVRLKDYKLETWDYRTAIRNAMKE